MYPPDVVVNGEWAYFVDEATVQQLFAASSASTLPCPGTDDDGESLLYVFNFLKSQLALLQYALRTSSIVVYGENTT